MTSTVGVVTLVAGRRMALRNLLIGLRRQRRPADRVVIVRMDDEPVVADLDGLPVHVADIDVADGDPLPLAAARNAGARACADVDVVVFLDADCIPGRDLVGTFGRIAASEEALVTGALAYLPSGVPGGDDWTEDELAAAGCQHPVRPAPSAGSIDRDDRHHLAWTTSLAIARQHFEALDGFDQRFVGYGAEDTDFAHRAAHHGLHVAWTGDAPAYHQHHGPAGLPVQHVDDIVRNATLFHELHGWFPMEGWLREFADLGLVELDAEGGRLRRLAATTAAQR